MTMAEGWSQPSTSSNAGSGHNLFYPDYGKFRQKKPAVAEDLAADAMAASMERWVVYEPFTFAGPFQQWLEENLPSQISRADGVGIIAVNAPNYDETQHPLEDLTQLQDSWEELKASRRPINRQTLTELAKMHNITRGKWLFHTSTGLKVNHLWSLVSQGVVEGRCGDTATVSPYDPHSNEESHVVCVYNSDFTNLEEVRDLEHAIRKLGIKCPLLFKPDIYSKLGIYRNNEWGITPTIYRSVYDIIRDVSMVTETQRFLDI